MKRGKPIEEKTFPWWHNSFDLEGIVGFLAGWLVGVLLGMLWGPLFWMGFIPGLLLLFATRRADRVAPPERDVAVAPCDGVVTSVEEVEPPEALRLTGRYKRVRIASSPFATTDIYAPIEGGLDHLIEEEGTAEAFAAMTADREGLSELYATIAGSERSVGIRVVTGGLGPRLEPRADAGDKVEMGKAIALRRLGGWCDVYIPAEGRALVAPGRTLIGGETRLWWFTQAKTRQQPLRDESVEAETPPNPETVPPELVEDVEEAAEEKSSDPAEMFARLRREASKLSGEDSES